MNSWELILEALKKKLTLDIFETWFSSSKFIFEDNSRIVVTLPNVYFREWIEDKYLKLINEILKENKINKKIEFLIESDLLQFIKMTNKKNLDGDKNEFIDASYFESSNITENGIKNSNFHKLYTFDTFVIGESNKLAYAAAKAVAENPSTKYNPLFIYGDSGLGKTHLLHAIGNEIKRRNPFLKVILISTESFLNELIASIRYKTTIQFREKYRSVDVLLVDDIQFLSGKDQTQEEFYHTFNTLYDSQNQIVLTSDRPPSEIENIEKRLISRFNWGIVADIKPPNLETKVAILQKKAELMDEHVPREVLLYIAENFKSNVRELEGALKKVTAIASLRGITPTIEVAKEALSNIIPSERKIITIQKIQRVVADYFKMKVSELNSKTNARNITEPRQIAMYLCKKLTDYSLPKIGKGFGGKHHSTVLHSIQKVEEKMESDPSFKNLVEKIESLIK